jgi:hypothetical protein
MCHNAEILQPPPLRHNFISLKVIAVIHENHLLLFPLLTHSCLESPTLDISPKPLLTGFDCKASKLGKLPLEPGGATNIAYHNIDLNMNQPGIIG